MKRISVIVPIYNSEKTLSRAIDSLLNQTIKEFDIVLVDDGSIDDSAIICDKYADEYANVTVVHKKNGGLSSSRNAGIDAADTEYIAFLDADDYFDSTFIENVLYVINSNSPDIICFGLNYIIDKVIEASIIPHIPYNLVLDKQYIHDYLLPPLLNLVKDEEKFIFAYSVNKVYKRKIISEFNIRFDETRRIWEDRPFVVEYLKYCYSFYCINECFYNYVSTTESLSEKYYLNFFDIVIGNYKNYLLWFGNEYDFNNQYSIDYWCHSIENIIFKSLKQKENVEAIQIEIIKTLKNELVIYWYKNRLQKDKYEKRATELVLNGMYEEAINYYRKLLKKKERIPFIMRVKSIIRKMIK